MTQTTISSYLMPLTRWGSMRKIHSIFEHSLNIIVGQRLINLTSYPTFLSSFGLRVTEADFQAIRSYTKVGDLVKISESQLVIYSRQKVQILSLKPTKVKDLAIGVVPYSEGHLQTVVDSITDLGLQKKLGLEFADKEKRFARQLAKAEIEPEMITYFIGRGKGLTPSGDDLLLGYLYMLKLYQRSQAATLQKLIQQSIKRTTIISENYFLALADGYVSSVFKDLNDYLINPNSLNLDEIIQAILAVGHTSGADMCYGLLLGAKAVQVSEAE
ncbi:hypothetical protein BAU15_07795 [Enterococcus sp. JM4C]|uniref:DUF2877 domain-containing protein n=1 Tax=Candidatus Enterococcus huntleyi TaxID=1857217 RepID=UPI001379F9CE|nr:DUF2877 domain-containing protein [Enterococcus sp. JM4C]KAF1297799.1 hypothetical protein BAU15_07795 [Enterococcus sp. JM4C]